MSEVPPDLADSDQPDETTPATPAPIPPTKRRAVAAWALWAWGSSAYSTIVTSFVFAPYLAGVVAKNLPAGWPSGATLLGLSLFIAGVFVFALAPVTGQRADAGGHRKRSLAVWSGLVIASTIGMFFIRDDYHYLLIGLALLAAGSVFLEFAQVSYNAMLQQISNPGNIGKISGIGWGSGYIGGIFVLLLAFVLFIQPQVGLFGVTAEGGLKYRALALVVAIWFAFWAIPIFLAIPEIPPTKGIPRVGFFASYKVLFNDVAALYRTERQAVWFLLASALFRDGLAAIFSFGSVLAVAVYGLSAADVVIFGVAANVVAAVGAFASGVLEDRLGPKPVIVIALSALVVTLLILLFVNGPTMFWIFGLFLCLWVGPAQSSSRTYLARLAPEGREGQMFGLYATTGRAVSFLAPGLFTLFAAAFHSPRMGIIGIALVLLSGLIALLPVKPPPRRQPHAVTTAALA
jgi:MFS transporter, UMF1 family